MIKNGQLRPLSDIHQAIDEDELMRAYDARAMHDLEKRAMRERALRAPLRAAEASGLPANSPRQILNDPAFSGRNSPWRNLKKGAGAGVLGALLGLFQKQSDMAEMARDEDYMMGPHLPWGGEKVNE